MGEEHRRPGSDADYSFGATGIADPANPTLAEVTALTLVECGFVDAVSRGRTGGTIDVSSLCSMESAEIAGRIRNEPLTGELWREVNGDSYWALFDDTAQPKVTQHFVVCAFGYSGALGVPAENDVVDIYTVQIMHRSPGADGADAGQRFGISLAVSAVNFDVSLPAA